MGRYANSFLSMKTMEQINFIANDFFYKEGFKQYETKGEMVWKLGSGILTAPQFIKLIVNNNEVYIEAWLKYPILPGVYVGEMGLTGFFGSIPKGMLRDRVIKLEQLIR